MDIAKVLRRIGEHPEMYQLVEEQVRRAVAERFPFSIFYQVFPEWIEVIAISHQARDPRVWKMRADEQDRSRNP